LLVDFDPSIGDDIVQAIDFDIYGSRAMGFDHENIVLCAILCVSVIGALSEKECGEDFLRIRVSKCEMERGSLFELDYVRV
jgi:hypothetical protein